MVSKEIPRPKLVFVQLAETRLNLHNPRLATWALAEDILAKTWFLQLTEASVTSKPRLRVRLLVKTRLKLPWLKLGFLQ